MDLTNIVGGVFVSLVILFVIIGCFYLIAQENTSIFFIARINQAQEPEKTMVFVGDIMLDRGVEHQIKQNNNNYFYPFEKISEFLKKFDIVFGNLEGPIVEAPPDFDNSFRFAFAPQTSKALSKAGFNLVSLANNHTDNMLGSGLFQTRVFLSQNSIDYVGTPSGCTQDFVTEKQGILFLAFNKTYSQNCSAEKIAERVKGYKTKNPEKLLVVSLHWGQEYKLIQSQEQQELAHLLIDNGADLIIGHHPHVVQNIELYHNKLIFYSLGNFIFDQYFSKETQQGLAVSVKLTRDKLIFQLYPIKAGIAQPFLMERSAKKTFLELLATRSSITLSQEIKKGKIVINSFK